jgi:hypothetical protein
MFSGCPSDYKNLHFIVYIKVMFVVLKGNLLDENLQIALKGLKFIVVFSFNLSRAT